MQTDQRFKAKIAVNEIVWKKTQSFQSHLPGKTPTVDDTSWKKMTKVQNNHKTSIITYDIIWNINNNVFVKDIWQKQNCCHWKCLEEMVLVDLYF